MLNINLNELEQAEVTRPTRGSQFGEYDDTDIGTDLTLEWDSNDPNLHEHLIEARQASEQAKRKSAADEEYYRYFKEAGLPDA